eukprot:6207613-Pleurochrysis_carterae.AAC.2
MVAICVCRLGTAYSSQLLAAGLAGAPYSGREGRQFQAAMEDAAGARNPFKMPTDEEVFALRDEEQRKKESERERAKQLHVWEKGVVSRPKVRDYEGDCDSQAQARDAQQAKLNLVAAATRDRRKEKENMAEFIAKKREMFLVQMSLDTKRAEIRKLEERAHQREEVRARICITSSYGAIFFCLTPSRCCIP